MKYYLLQGSFMTMAIHRFAHNESTMDRQMQMLIGHLMLGDGMCSNLHMAETIKFLGGLPLMTLTIYFSNDKGLIYLLLFFVFQSLTFFGIQNKTWIMYTGISLKETYE